MSLGPVQRLLTNPMAVALDRVLAVHGPATLEQWIQGHTRMVDEIPAGGLEEAVAGHPMLKRVAGGVISRALDGWGPEWAAAVLDTMYAVAPAVAVEEAPPPYQERLAVALQQMCQRLAQPDAFPWFCAQCGLVAARVQAVLRDNPAPAS
jgi:hypothetical protein